MPIYVCVFVYLCFVCMDVLRCCGADGGSRQTGCGIFGQSRKRCLNLNTFRRPTQRCCRRYIARVLFCCTDNRRPYPPRAPAAIRDRTQQFCDDEFSVTTKRAHLYQKIFNERPLQSKTNQSTPPSSRRPKQQTSGDFLDLWFVPPQELFRTTTRCLRLSPKVLTNRTPPSRAQQQSIP